jgi:hypothetical protein
MERRSVLWFRRGILLACALILAGSGSGIVTAQTQAVRAPNQAPTQNLPPQQLDNLVAPIALYPDPLLGQVLAASTYPVELVEAQQWLQANPNLRGQQLTDAARQQNWDPSVQALVAMPDVLNTLTQDIHWTTDLGDAFLAQQSDVVGAVQRMRQTAEANGQLQSNQQETVTTENQGGQQAIQIEPANPQVIYVPEYDPYYVYGWGAYPPMYYPDGYWFGPGIDVGFYFGGWGGWGFGGFGWGWGVNWFGRGLFVNNAFFNRYGYHYGLGLAGGIAGRTAWAHDPAHRLGAGYPGGQLSSRFGAASQASRVAAGRAGNWHTFGEDNVGRSANSFARTAPQSAARGGEAFRGGQSYRSEAPTQRYSTPAQRSAPAYQSPQRSVQAAPRMSAPAPSYGGGARSFGSGGGSRSFGGGGGSHSSGGHGGGGRR